MALIKCPECGKEVSDKAPACIQCGYPLLAETKVDRTPFKRIFRNGTMIGYPCKTCDCFNQIYKVTYSDAEITEAECTECQNKEEIDFSNVVITYEEYDDIDEEVRLKNYAGALQKLISITNCDESVCQKYIEQVKNDLDMIAKELGEDFTNTFKKDMPRPVVSHTPKCPICNSYNLKKITSLSKAGSVLMWGVFASGRTSKQWHCNDCGSEW